MRFYLVPSVAPKWEHYLQMNSQSAVLYCHCKLNCSGIYAHHLYEGLEPTAHYHMLISPNVVLIFYVYVN